MLTGFERANESLLERFPGAVTTLAVALVEGMSVRSFHVGDSEILLMGQRGAVRLETICHSPVG